VDAVHEELVVDPGGDRFRRGERQGKDGHATTFQAE
jgi:hypothetical protein